MNSLEMERESIGRISMKILASKGYWLADALEKAKVPLINGLKKDPNKNKIKIPNPNESGCVVRVVYPQPKCRTQGIGATIFDKNIKIYFVSYSLKIV